MAALRSLCRWPCNVQLVPLPRACASLCRATIIHNSIHNTHTGSLLYSCGGQPGHLYPQLQRQQPLSSIAKASKQSSSSANDGSDAEEDDHQQPTDVSSTDTDSGSNGIIKLQPEKPLRVERLLANLGYGKRQECVVMVKRRRLVYAATGKPAKVGEKAVADELLLDGEPLDPPPPLSIILHKPTGYVVTSPDDENVLDPKIYDLLPYRFGRRRPFLSAIGRLDKETSGLLLLTDDGKLLHSIQSPTRGIWKLYTAQLAAPLAGAEAAAAVRRFASGRMQLQGDRTPLLPAGLRMLDDTTAEVAICEGRYHQIRRMFAALGHEVVALHRHAIGGLSLAAQQDLPLGSWRLATVADLTAVLSGPDLQESILQQQATDEGGEQQQRQQQQQLEEAEEERSVRRRSKSSRASSSSSGSSGSGMYDVADELQQGQVWGITAWKPAQEDTGAGAAWYADSNSSSGGSSIDVDAYGVADDLEQLLNEEDPEQVEEQQLAGRRYRSSTRWAKRRAAIARSMQAMKWEQKQKQES